MENISLQLDKVYGFVSKETVMSYRAACEAAQSTLEKGDGKGSDFLGWLHLPSSISEPFLDEIQETADALSRRCEVVVVAGIGGSYLGSKAVTEALNNSFAQLQRKGCCCCCRKKHPVVLFAGHNISEDYLAELVNYLKHKSFGIINISKSGTTTETALAFRLLKTLLEKKVGKREARQRIVAITDARKGALRTLATQEAYKTYVIPDNVGGRYSVLTPVGLLPIAVAGYDIHQLVAGAAEMEKQCAQEFDSNIAMQYAAARQALYAAGKKIEILVNYHPKLHYVSEWWKQLYGESEGKENKGLYPASVDLTTDLHSMGQWIQQGERIILETVVSIAKPRQKVEIPFDQENLDGLNYLAGKRVDEVNKMAELGTQIAHVDGGVPNIKVVMPELNEYYLGQLMYFFEKACGISGYVMGINPFDQPGVEDYKRNMFALLEKPGYEEATKAIKERLK